MADPLDLANETEAALRYVAGEAATYLAELDVSDARLRAPTRPPPGSRGRCRTRAPGPSRRSVS